MFITNSGCWVLFDRTMSTWAPTLISEVSSRKEQVSWIHDLLLLKLVSAPFLMLFPLRFCTPLFRNLSRAHIIFIPLTAPQVLVAHPLNVPSFLVHWDFPIAAVRRIRVDGLLHINLMYRPFLEQWTSLNVISSWIFRWFDGQELVLLLALDFVVGKRWVPRRSDFKTGLQGNNQPCLWALLKEDKDPHDELFP